MNEVLSYVYDFLSRVFEDKTLKDMIRNVVLFGSVAKNTYDKDSDIDLFFDVKDKEAIIENTLKGVLRAFESGAEKTWRLKGIDLPIKFIVGSLDDEKWGNIKEEVISSGIVLYGDYKEMPENVRHYFLFYYSLSKLSPKDKMKFIREVFGYALKKEKKEYKQKGILDEIEGVKLASNVIMVQSSDISRMKGVFNKYKVKYKIIETWVRK